MSQWDVYDKKLDKITYEEFEESYKDLSVTIDDDLYFI